MKRTVLATLALLLCAGCATSAPDPAPDYRDGVYTAEAEDYSDSGWKDTVTVIVEDGKITEAEWNAVNEEGQDKKSLSQSGEYGMKAGGAKSEWHEQAQSLEAELVRQQDPGKIGVNSSGQVDSVSGVSIAASEFVQLAEEALSKAK